MAYTICKKKYLYDAYSSSCRNRKYFIKHDIYSQVWVCGSAIRQLRVLSYNASYGNICFKKNSEITYNADSPGEQTVISYDSFCIFLLHSNVDGFEYCCERFGENAFAHIIYTNHIL